VLPGKAPIAAHAHALTPEEKQKTLDLEFIIERPKDSEFKDRVAKGEVITPKERRELYSPSKESVAKLIEWLKGNGLEVSSQNSDGTSIYAKATVATIEKALKVDSRS